MCTARRVHWFCSLVEIWQATTVVLSPARADATSSKCCSNQRLYKGCANKMATRVRQQPFFFSEALKLCSCLNWRFKEASISPLKDHRWCPIAKCRTAFQVNWLCAVDLWGKQCAVNPQTCCTRVKWPMHMSQRKFQDSNKGKRNLRLRQILSAPSEKSQSSPASVLMLTLSPKQRATVGSKH